MKILLPQSSIAMSTVNDPFGHLEMLVLASPSRREPFMIDQGRRIPPDKANGYMEITELNIKTWKHAHGSDAWQIFLLSSSEVFSSCIRIQNAVGIQRRNLLYFLLRAWLHDLSSSYVQQRTLFPGATGLCETFHVPTARGLPDQQPRRAIDQSK